jgi:transcriptional regulator with XRE-family HTH domain
MGVRYKPVSSGKNAKNLPLTRDDFTAALSATGLMVSEVARESGVHRNYLSEFKAGTRNLQTNALKRLRDYFESKGVVFTEEEGVELEDVDDESQASKVFPVPSISVAIGRELDPDERDVAVAKLDKIVRKNDRLMDFPIEYDDGEMADASQRLHEELRSGLVDEAIYRRVLDGSFDIRQQETIASTHAEELANGSLGALILPDDEGDAKAVPAEDSDSKKLLWVP